MGAWGYKIFENDDALNFMDNISKPIEKILQKVNFSEYYYNEIRAAIEVAIFFHKAGYVIYISEGNCPWTQSALQKLNTILNNTEYIKGWDNQEKIKQSLKTQIENIKKLV